MACYDFIHDITHFHRRTQCRHRNNIYVLVENNIIYMYINKSNGCIIITCSCLYIMYTPIQNYIIIIIRPYKILCL